jgi:type II secretory pathway component PulK
MSRERGFAMVAVLMVLAFVAIIGAEFAYSMRLEATAARAYKENLIAGHLAEAAIEQAIREIAAPYTHVTLGDRKEQESEPECPLVFFSAGNVAMPRLPHKNVPLGTGAFSYCITDEQARLNLNTSPPLRIGALLQALGIEKNDRDAITDSLQDWRDTNETYRTNGAESEDTYLKRPVPYRSKNGILDSVGELLQVKGITPELMDGTKEHPGLAALVTVKGPGQINVNTVGKEVAKALGISEAEFSDIEQKRRAGPYVSPDARFTARGLNAVRTQTFRIEAQGLIDGQVRATITAVVEKRIESGGENVSVLEWSGIR